MLIIVLLFLATLANSLDIRWINSTKPHIIALSSKATCSYVTIKSGQSAYDACGGKVSVSDLKKYNPNVDFNKLEVGQYICCSSGSLPDFRPDKNSDGSCKTYTVKKGDTCSAIISKYYPLSIDDLNKYNKNTYNWGGCNNLQLDQKICISDGTPPRPTPDPKAECGPLAPGDLYNSKCPLNACCSEFGFCGLTSEFCDKKSSNTGAPGTEGCFSNCGYGSLHGDSRGDFEKIAYWMDSQGKLASNPLNVNNKYTRVHYAFVNINSDYSIDESRISTSGFLSITPKKIASFGGWDFSTSPSTYKIFREGVKSSNRDKFVNNIVNFANKYSLDGIDLDWEYPGAPDIPGIPADDKNNGKNYLEFVKLLKSKLGSKTLSMAIPSSYWYLKNYPIKDIQNYLDYMVFMTYDIYGTWDIDKDNHIKCHVNKSATIESLKMLDKAGVQIGKTYGGIANYGRSYKASSSSCLKENCPFSGPGNKREITNTPGILADSEIIAIDKSSAKNDRWTNLESDCIFMRYDGDSIVSWGRDRNSMSDFFHSHGLKGSVLWVDNYFVHDDFDGNVNYTNNDVPKDDYWNNIMDEEATILGEMTNFDASLSSGSACSKDPSSIDLDTETDANCLYLKMSYELLNNGVDALDYIKNIDKNSYNNDHRKYVNVISDSLWGEFDDWLGYNLFKTDKNDKDGEGDQYYNCMHNGKPMPDEEKGQCITDNSCFNKACEVFGSNGRRISNFVVKDGMKDEAAKSFSDYSGLTVKGSDFVKNTKPKKVKQSGGQTITYKNCDFVDFSKEFPNPLDKIDNEYLGHMQSIIDKVKYSYTKNPIEAYYSLTPLAALKDVSDTMKTVKKEAKKFRAGRTVTKNIINYRFVLWYKYFSNAIWFRVNLAVDTALLIATTVAELKLEGKVSGDSLAFGLIAIIQPFIKFPKDSLVNIFKNIDLSDVSKLNGKFKSNSKFEDIIKSKIKSKYC
uniref:Chitin binding protein n=1 Tax=Millerozyma acaciae TaxID=28986 RepID=Q707V5_9ASCO|nr:chitin binding protein [Millerozyma acaciae]